MVVLDAPADARLDPVEEGLVQQPGVAAIPRTSRKERLAENLDIFDFALSEPEMAAISALQAANRRLCDFAFSPEWDKPA